MVDDGKKQNFAKYFSIFFSFILIVCGASLLTLGVLAETVRRDYEAISTFSSAPSTVVITLSLGVIAVGVMGLVGFKLENIKMMRMFLYISVVLIILELCVGILCFVYAEVAAEHLAEDLNFNVTAYGLAENGKLSETIDKMQREFQCCGHQNFLDWKKHSDYSCAIYQVYSQCSVPQSCCTEEDWRKCVFTPINASNGEFRGNVASTGCGEAFMSWVESKVDTIGIASLVVIIPQVVCGLVLNWLVQYVDLKGMIYELQI